VSRSTLLSSWRGHLDQLVAECQRAKPSLRIKVDRIDGGTTVLEPLTPETSGVLRLQCDEPGTSPPPQGPRLALLQISPWPTSMVFYG
jgi:hypothetical protein